MTGRLGRSPSRIGARVLAVTLGAVLALVVLELGYRAVRLPGLSPTTHPAYVRHDAELGWSYRPGIRERHTSPAFDVTVAINAQGFRGPDWTAAPSERPCVLILGDSFAFGWGVEYERTFGALLAEETGWDVRNAAISGFGTGQQRLLLERLLRTVRPDLVIQVFCWNDLFESSSASSYGKPKPYYTLGPDGLELHGRPVPDPLLARWSLLARAVRKWRWQHEQMTREVDRDAEWALVLALLADEKRLLGDVPLLVLSDRSPIASFARETAGVEHVDLRDAFAGATELLAFPDDGHWTPPAHAYIEKALRAAAERLLAGPSEAGEGAND